MTTPATETDAPAAEDTAAPSTGDGTDAPQTEKPKPGDEVDWRAKFEAQQKVTRDLEKKVKGEAGTLQKELAELKAKMEGREAEHAAEIEAQRAKDEALAVANERILKAEIRAQAAGKLADPQDALRFLNLSEFEVGTDGEVDGDAVSDAINDLITSKPYLSAQGKRFQGDADGGARKESTPPQLTRDDMARMTPEQIADAHDKGQFDSLTGS